MTHSGRSPGRTIRPFFIVHFLFFPKGQTGSFRGRNERLSGSAPSDRSPQKRKPARPAPDATRPRDSFSASQPPQRAHLQLFLFPTRSSSPPLSSAATLQMTDNPWGFGSPGFSFLFARAVEVTSPGRLLCISIAILRTRAEFVRQLVCCHTKLDDTGRPITSIRFFFWFRSRSLGLAE